MSETFSVYVVIVEDTDTEGTFDRLADEAVDLPIELGSGLSADGARDLAAEAEGLRRR